MIDPKDWLKHIFYYIVLPVILAVFVMGILIGVGLS